MRKKAFSKSKVSFSWDCNLKSVVLNYFCQFLKWFKRKKSTGSFQKQGFSCRFTNKYIFIESKFDNTIVHTPVSIELHSGKKVLQLKLLWKRLSYAGVAFLVRVSLKLKSCFRSQNIVCIHKQGRQLCGCITFFEIFLHFETSRQGIHSICENSRPKNYGCTH